MIPETEFECASRLYEIRWPNGLTCGCGGQRHRRIKTRPRVFVCRACRCHTSVTAGTLMHACHIPMRHWFVAAKMMSQRSGPTAASVGRALEVSYETAWQLLHRIRAAMDANGRWLLGELVFAVRTARTSRPYTNGGPRRRFGNHSRLLGVASRSKVALGERTADTGTWLRDLGLDEPPPYGRAAARILNRLWVKLQYVHCGVSELWLHRYITELEVQTNRTGMPLRDVMNASRSRFDDLRPLYSSPVR